MFNLFNKNNNQNANRKNSNLDSLNFNLFKIIQICPNLLKPREGIIREIKNNIITN
jgi:hypothetical protein